MDTGIVIAAVIILIPVVVIWRMARATARTVYALESRIENLRQLEAKVAKQNATIAEQRDAIDGLRVNIAAQNVIIEFQGVGIEELQAEVATWRDRFDALIAWVRAHAPEAPINGFLAQLEAGQG